MLEVFRVELVQLVVGFVAVGFVIVAEISSDLRVSDPTRLDHFLREKNLVLKEDDDDDEVYQ